MHISYTEKGAPEKYSIKKYKTKNKYFFLWVSALNI